MQVPRIWFQPDGVNLKEYTELCIEVDDTQQHGEDTETCPEDGRKQYNQFEEKRPMGRDYYNYSQQVEETCTSFANDGSEQHLEDTRPTNTDDNKEQHHEEIQIIVTVHDNGQHEDKTFALDGNEYHEEETCLLGDSEQQRQEACATVAFDGKTRDTVVTDSNEEHEMV